MTAKLHGIRNDAGRKRKAHKKSRKACPNCRVRRVKCDETRPMCQKCTDFGVSCSYDPKAPVLEMSFDRPGMGTKQDPLPGTTLEMVPSWSPNSPPISFPMMLSDDTSVFELDGESLDRLYRFQARTILSIGTAKGAQLHQKVIFDLASANPYLMHVVQTLTAIHDRILAGSFKPSVTEAYHWSRATALFSRKLSQPIKNRDRDPLWAAAALQGIISLAWVDATTPEESWPLKAEEACDLEWLRMTDGKKAVWDVVNPLRLDSVFRPLALEISHGAMHPPPPKPRLEGVPPAFIQLYDLDEWSTFDNNPYYSAVLVLVPLLQLQCNRSNILKFLQFLSDEQLAFKRLIELKDPRALLLLAYWYAKVWDSQWWLAQRATIECKAICIYLERYHRDETAIQKLLLFPKMRCGFCVDAMAVKNLGPYPRGDECWSIE